MYECKRIIEAHRGTIRVDSEVGKGTSVRIELPIAPHPNPLPLTLALSPQGERRR
ncbi:MAG: hypothetical protein ACRD1P_05385 [Thermoanaerobaculia bacterium]